MADLHWTDSEDPSLLLGGGGVRAMSLAIFVPRGTKPYSRKGAIRRFRPGSMTGEGVYHFQPGSCSISMPTSPGARVACTMRRKAYCTISSCSRDNNLGSNRGLIGASSFGSKSHDFRYRLGVPMGYASSRCREKLLQIRDIYELGNSRLKMMAVFAALGVRMFDAYVEVISLVERLHRQFLEVVKLELDGLGIHDINNVQGLMLFNIGDAEMTVTELTLRGCYLGSNASYNVKKMVENGYLSYERSMHDRRSIHVRLTEKGAKLRDQLQSMHQRQVEMLNQTAITDEDLQAATATLRRLERFWIRVPDINAATA
jgi:DNA-binding MarR family transcriptional regulator